MNENEADVKKPSDLKRTFFSYLKANPSLIIAVVSAIVTGVSLFSSYVGRLANVVYLKYWKIDSFYAGIEKINVLYRIVESAIWIVAILGVSIILQNVFIRYYHYSAFNRYAKAKLKELSREHHQTLKQNMQAEENFWSDKSSTAEDFLIWKLISLNKKRLADRKEEIRQVNEMNNRAIWSWRSFLILALIGSEILLFFSSWVATIAITFNELLLTFFQSSTILIFISVLSYRSTKNQRASQIESVMSENPDAPFAECVDQMQRLENEQYERNRFVYKPDLKTFLLNLLLATAMIFVSMPIEGYCNARLTRSFWIVSENEKNEAIIFHGEDTYIFEEVEFDENTIIIDTSKQRILKTDDISFEKRTFDSVVKK